MFTDIPNTIKGVTVNANRKVNVERGLVYDFASDSYVDGFYIGVGTSGVAVTDRQAERIVDFINMDFFAEDDARERSKRNHPSYRMREDD